MNDQLRNGDVGLSSLLEVDEVLSLILLVRKRGGGWRRGVFPDFPLPLPVTLVGRPSESDFGIRDSSPR